MIVTIAKKEFQGLLAHPSTWLILGLFQFIFAWFFLSRLDIFLQLQAQLAQIANAPGATLAVATPLFGILALILMMLAPILTMRLIAEERRNHTLTLFMTAPVSETQIVLGKFFGALAILLLIIAASTLMVMSLAAGTRLDTGLVLSNALGLTLLAASDVALGLYISTLTAQPAIAAIGALAALFGLWLFDAAAEDSDNALRAFTPASHFQSFNTGLINSADVVYFALFSAFFLMLAIQRLYNNRIHG